MTQIIAVKPANIPQERPLQAFVLDTSGGLPAGGDTVILWERDDRHPQGEIFISTGSPVTRVARTERVNRLILDRVLEIVDEGGDDD